MFVRAKRKNVLVKHFPVHLERGTEMRRHSGIHI